jgi:hypothetical protein
MAKQAAQRRLDLYKAQRACVRFIIALVVACMVAMLVTGIAMVSVASEQPEDAGLWPLANPHTPGYFVVVAGGAWPVPVGCGGQALAQCT